MMITTQHRMKYYMHNVHNSKAFQHGTERYFNPFKRKLIVYSREVPWSVWVHYFNVFFQKWLHTDWSGFLFTFGVYDPLTRVNYLIYTAGGPCMYTLNTQDTYVVVTLHFSHTLCWVGAEVAPPSRSSCGSYESGDCAAAGRHRSAPSPRGAGVSAVWVLRSHSAI